MHNNTSIENINRMHKSGNRLRFKPIIIVGIVILFLIIAIIVVAATFHSEFPVLKYPRTNTTALQIYAALDDEMTFDELEQVVHSVDSNAQINKEEFYGEIRPSDGSNQAILFSFDNADMNSEIEEEEEYPSDFTPKYHDPNIAYDFKFIFDTTFESSPNLYKDELTSTYRYDDGGYSFFEFDTKQEALDAYLAPEVNR